MTQTALSSELDARARIKASGLFDSRWYVEQYPWTVEGGESCLEHYLRHGERNNRFPNQYFNPHWYRKKYLTDGSGGECCLLHYIDVGRFRGNLPAPDFSPVAYIKEHAAVELKDALYDWLHGNRDIVPSYEATVVAAYEVEKTGLFDAQWYSQSYPDVSNSGMSPLEHYCAIGIRENRNPNRYFDAQWYLKSNPHVKSEVSPIVHYARHGWRNGKAPSVRFNPSTYVSDNYNIRSFDTPPIEPLKHLLLSSRSESIDSLVSELSMSQPPINRKAICQVFGFRDYLSEPGFRIFRTLCGDSVNTLAVRQEFSARLTKLSQTSDGAWIKRSGCLESVASVFLPDSALIDSGAKFIDSFHRFVSNLRQIEKIGNGLFDADFYKQVTGSNKIDGECLLEWASSAGSQSVVPNRYFDPVVYSKVAGLDEVSPRDLYDHWLYVGMFDNRRINSFIDLGYIAGRMGVTRDENIFLKYFYSRGISFSPRHEVLESKYPSEVGGAMILKFNELTDLDNLRYRIGYGALADQIAAAAEYDPKIIEKGMGNEISMPPFNNLLAPVVKRVRTSLVKNKYDNVLLIPHCRLSGATKIAGKFAESLSSAREGSESILIVLTDKDINKHPEWFPDSAEVFSFASITEKLEKDNRECALFDLLVGVQAKRVVNFNSELGWSVFERYGSRLATRTALCAYFYCYDLNRQGVKVGYPSKHFISTFTYMSMVYFDSDYLRREITQKNRIDNPDDLSRIKTLYTPVDIPDVVREDFADTRSVSKIYWAGRLDRQKNFDLVIRIATLLPDYQFECWGESVIGDYDVEAVPDNITINKPYSHIDEVLPGDCDLWLYTSRWDGIPNLLLEVGVRQVPIVSTAVWGTTDILSPHNCWLVSDIDDETKYVQAIEECIGSGEARISKAMELRQKIKQRHNNKSYQDSILKSLP